MSLDAVYILSYYNLGYIEPTPMQIDVRYLEENFGGKCEYIDCSTIYYDKPKYTLLPEQIEKLLADQILERKDCELWTILIKEPPCAQ
jgi:hypothetical protein